MRKKTLAYIKDSANGVVNLEVIEQAMDAVDALRRIKTDDPYLQTVQMFGLRIFNGFASSLGLLTTGYYQKSAMIVRDLLETSWLIDLFRLDKTELEAWHKLGDDERRSHFKPWKVRRSLNRLYGTPDSIRDSIYKTFCELAAHPTPQSYKMLTPDLDGARSGPFFNPRAIDVMLFQTSRVGIEVCDTMADFFNRPTFSLENWDTVYSDIIAKRDEWMKVYHPK
ncbi:hypothetical protein [Phyllobacterium sp. P5_D12]